jgi:RNA polymerase sigma-70 factor (ECF subfamily)
MPKDKDESLIRAFVKGDRAERETAFRTLYERYKDKVFRTARRLTGDQDAAMDVTQEAFVLVYRNLRKFKFQSAFATWLFRIAYNCALERRRRKGSDSSASLSMDDSEVTEAQLIDRRTPPLEVTAQRHELLDQFRKALDRLGGPFAEILALRYLDDLSYEEIAGGLGLEIGTVKSRLCRAHRAFEPFLKELRVRFGGEELPAAPEADG